MVVRAYNSSTGRWKQEDWEFEVGMKKNTVFKGGRWGGEAKAVSDFYSSLPNPILSKDPLDLPLNTHKSFPCIPDHCHELNSNLSLHVQTEFNRSCLLSLPVSISKGETKTNYSWYTPRLSWDQITSSSWHLTTTCTHYL
jgi:hypothetical protein